MVKEYINDLNIFLKIFLTIVQKIDVDLFIPNLYLVFLLNIKTDLVQTMRSKENFCKSEGSVNRQRRGPGITFTPSSRNYFCS